MGYIIFAIIYYIMLVFSWNQELALRRTLKTLSFFGSIKNPNLEDVRYFTDTSLTRKTYNPTVVNIDNSSTGKIYLFTNHNTNNWILYIHGGGYVSGTINLYNELCGELSQTANVVYVDYRLCPEYTMTDALDDLQKGYNWAKNKFSGKNLIIADSAGGGYAVRLRERLNTPIFTILYSPWISIDKNNSIEDDAIFTKELIDWGRTQIKYGNEPKTLLYSKENIMTFYGDNEYLICDSLDIPNKTKHYNVHVLVLFYKYSSEAKQILDLTKKKIHKYLTKL